MPWYKYQPPNCMYCNPCDPINYILFGNTPPSCPAPKIYICAIQAMDNGGKPIITPSLCAEIIAALNNSADSTNVHLRATNKCHC